MTTDTEAPAFSFVGADLPLLPGVPARDLTATEYDRVYCLYGDALVRLRWQPLAPPADEPPADPEPA